MEAYQLLFTEVSGEALVFQINDSSREEIRETDETMHAWNPGMEREGESHFDSYNDVI